MDKVTQSNAGITAAAEELKAPAATMKSSVAAAALPTTWRSGFTLGNCSRADGDEVSASAIPLAGGFKSF